MVLWLGLAQTFSQSSFIALLAGLAVLAAIRWSWRWTLAAVAVGVVGAVLVVILVGGSGKVNFSTASTSTPAAAPTSSPGGVDLFAERPLRGYGSGSFQHAYRDHRENKDVPVSVSHTEPVTVAAEQGLLGLLALRRPDRRRALDDGRAGLLAAPPSGPAGQRPAPPSSPPSSPCWSTRWPTPASSRTRSPGCCWRSAPRWRTPPRPAVRDPA